LELSDGIFDEDGGVQPGEKEEGGEERMEGGHEVEAGREEEKEEEEEENSFLRAPEEEENSLLRAPIGTPTVKVPTVKKASFRVFHLYVFVSFSCMLCDLCSVLFALCSMHFARTFCSLLFCPLFL
jgi:hypothetical protein